MRPTTIESADGGTVFDYWQAKDRAIELASGERPETEAPRKKAVGPLTIGAVLDAYLKWARTHQRSPETTATAIEKLIRPTFGDMLAADLTAG